MKSERVRMILASLAMLVWPAIMCGAAHGREERWSKLTEDAELVFHIDEKSIQNTRSGTTIFWVKLTGRKNDFLRNEYKLPELDYILFNYEIDCNKGIYKPRGIYYYARSGKQLDKQVPLSTDMTDAEPVPPESVMELAQNYVCAEELSLPEAQSPSSPELEGGAPGLSPETAPAQIR
ncbi:surface-adhesin E family protein [Geobacter sp. DSM 9736]|uniref:surface-adhesin E family protein n=1 Tax=Geobacter sp. DSM 9736 TaxID=1277350 RepID=UPI000B5022E1|nr:surface-adhesin E family protein [Geobacter sp. DSM 9736]SNB46929.1 hypothetical protein SAMN06269301_2401 [Geobacter sp. DSM 9736]